MRILTFVQIGHSRQAETRTPRRRCPGVLTNSPGEQVGLSVASTRSNEKPVEINPTF
jgi:hypothetical protein